MAKNSLPSELDLVQQPSYGLPEWAQRPQAQTVSTGGAVPFQAEFLSASQKYGVPFNVLMGLAEQESSFNPTAIGVPTKYGRAKGLMQYIDDTASRMGINPYDPVQSIDAAARQLRERLDKGYSMQEAVQAHFGGDDRAQWGPKTAQYGKDVLGRAEKFLGGGQSVAAGQPTQQQEQPQTRMGQIAQDYPPAQSAMENLEQTRQRTQALLDEMNKEEPGRYRPLSDEEMQQLSQHITPEMQQQAMQSGKPIEINIPDLVQPGQAVTAQQSVTQQPQKQPEGNKDGNLFTDALALLDSGFNTAAKDVQELVGKIPYIGKPIVDAADRFDRWANGKSSQELFKAYDESVERRLSPEMLAARRKSFVIEPGDDLGDGKKSTSYNFGPAWSDPRAYMSGLLESLPEMALTMGGSGRLAQMAYRRALASGASREVAAKAAARTATVAGGILEGGLSGAQSSREVREDILKMKPEQLANSDAMKSLMDGGLSFEQARAQLAENASSQAFMLAGISTGIFGGMGDRALAKIITNRAGGRVKAALAGALGEGVFEEMPQSATQQMSQNYAMQQADPNTPLMKGVANQAAAGLAVGGLMGAGMGAAAPRVSESNPADQTQEDSGSSIPTVKFEDNGPPPGYTGEWRDGGPVITITEGNGQSSTEQPQEVKPSGPLGRALQAGVQQTTEDVAAQAQQNTAAAENHTPDEFMGPVGAETMVIPSDDPESAFPAVVQEYRNGNAVVADQNGEILEFGPHEVVRPDAAADVVQQQPAQAVNEPAQQVEQATEEQPRQPKAVSEMTEPELRDRLKYLHQQAKSSGGWNERLTKARREVEKEIDAKNAPVQGEIDTEAVQANGLTPSENRRLKELLNKDSRTQAESAEATRLNEKSRASLTEEVPQSASENTVGAEGMTLVHGSGNGNLTLDDIQIVRANGQKQGKKGRVYGGFYGTSEKDSAQAEGYAGMMEGTPTVYDVKIKPGTKVFQKEGDITRLSENTINDLVSKGYGVVVGTDPRGRTEYAVIDKNAIQGISQRGKTQEQVASNEEQNPTLNKDGSQKWFGTERKANEYLQKKGITGTHEIRLVDRRFEIHAKGQDGTLTNEGTIEKAAPPKGKNGPRYNRVKKLLGAEEGDIVTPQEDIGYTTAGRQYRIDQIEKNGIVHLTNLETNGGTTVSLGELERAKSRKSGFNRVETVAAPEQDYQKRNIERLKNIRSATTQSEVDAIVQAEMSDNERDFSGTTAVERAAREQISTIRSNADAEEARSAAKKNYDQGGKVMVREFYNEYEANNFAEKSNKEDPASVYAVEQPTREASQTAYGEVKDNTWKVFKRKSGPTAEEIQAGEKYAADRVMPQDEVNSRGDDRESPWLFADGRIIGSNGDHISLSDAFGYDGYRDMSLGTGAIRSQFYKGKGDEQSFVSLQLFDDQKLTPEQYDAIASFSNANNAKVMLGVDRSGNNTSNVAKEEVPLSELRKMAKGELRKNDNSSTKRKSGFNRVESVAETAPTAQKTQHPESVNFSDDIGKFSRGTWDFISRQTDEDGDTTVKLRSPNGAFTHEVKESRLRRWVEKGVLDRVPSENAMPSPALNPAKRIEEVADNTKTNQPNIQQEEAVQEQAAPESLSDHLDVLEKAYGKDSGYSQQRKAADSYRSVASALNTDDQYSFHKGMESQYYANRKAAIDLARSRLVSQPEQISSTDTDTPSYGANNKLVSQDRAAELRKKLKAKFSQLNSGLDPEILAIGTELAVFHLEAGVRKFADFARTMAADLDVPINRLRPYLRSWYNGGRDMMEDSGISIEGMDSPETVRAELAKLDQAPVKEEAPAQTAPKAENQAPVNQPAPASQARTTSALDDMVSAFDNEVTPNVSGIRTGMEPDSRNAADAVSGNENPVLDGSGRNNRSDEQPGQRAEQERGIGQRDQRVSADGAASRREPGNQPVHQPNGQFVAEGRDAGNSERSGSRSDSPARSPVEQQRRRAIVDNAHAAGAGDLDSRLKAQKAAKGAPTTWADKASIDAALPLLLPEQRGDVLKIEQRHQVATGVLSTNGTGTGKTATGLGAAKRFYNAGKKNIAIVVPTDKVASDWVKFAGMMDMPLRQLSGIDDAGGSGPIVTTYANFGQNDALYSRQWDLIIPDESHYLSSNANGDSTAALDKLRGLTGHPEGFQHWLIGNNKELSDQLNEQRAILNKMNSAQAGYQAQEQKVNRLTEQWQAIEQPARREWQQRWTEQRDLPKVVFLSATPFAYVKNTDYAEGYLFHHTPPAERYTENSTGGYNSANDRERFYMEHFGYRMRYNKLTQPEAGVNTELMEQNFNQWLKDTGALFGRRLDVPFDYDRRFQLIDDAAGKKLDDALRFLNEAENGIYRPIYDEVMRTFDYQRRMFLLESMKARAAVPVIREHLKLGRKVVVFHDYNQGGGFSPFAEVLTEMKDLDMRSTASELFQRPMFRINFSGLDSAINTIKKAFPNVLLFNGTVSKGKRRQNADFFNADNSGKNLILVQSDAGREGVSLHDTTGKHQRVEINLGMPTRPVAATQIEGRIYRTGQASDAIFRYMTTGTSWEASTFASKIAERAATAENLALGEEARGLKQSFIDAYNEAEPMQASREDGKGGKERDQALSQNITPFDKAKTFYWAQQKNTKRRDQREGQDYFATPEPVGLKMVEWANIKPGDKVLEPSAGHGAIARFFPAQSDVTMVEPSYDLSQRAALANGTARIINGRFEDLSRANKFDAIVMNPPFGTGGKTAYEHLAKAAKHLRQGGRLVALVPRGGISERRFDQFFGGDEAKGLDLVARIKMPWVTFERAGTKVATEVLVFERHDKSDGSIIPVRPDLSSAQTINELFDRIEGLTLPERQPLTADEAIANAADGTMYSVPQVQQQTAREFAASLREENPGLKIDLVGSGKVVTLSRIVVPDDARNSGTGTAVMQRLTQWADQNGKTLALSPSGDFGGNKARLGEFYKRFGFVENKGRAKDYEISETMYREPQETRMSVTADPGTVTRGETGEQAQQLLDSGRLELHSAPPAPEYAAAGGWIDPDGKIHLALYNLRPEDVQPTLMHELFHAGMRNIGGDRRWVNLMDRLGQYYRAAQNGGAKNEWTSAVERIQNAQRQGDRMNDAARDHVIEELGAYAVENFEKMPAGIRKWAESIIGAVKNYLQQTFGLQLGKVTPGQLRALAAGAIRNQKAPATSTAFSTPESSQPPKAAEKQSWFNQRWDEVADLPDNMLKTVMPALLRFTPGRFILKRVGKDIPALGRYADVKLQMDTLRDEWHAKTDQESQKWLKYRVSKPQENAELMGLMHDSTLAQVDPSKDFQSILNAIDLTALREKKRGDPAWDEANQKAQDDAKRKEEHGKLRERYNALSPEGKQIYNRVRDLYSRLADAQEQAIIDNMEKAMDIRSRQVRRKFEDEMQRITDEGLKGKDKEDAIAAAKKALNNGLRKDAWNRRARINQLRSEFESNRLAGPYFPLARFGDFFVTARKKGSGEVVSFSRTETAFAQTRLRKQLEKEGYDVETGIVSKSNDLRKQVPADFVARIEDLLKGIEGTQQTQDQVWQLYLQTMPDYSLRKSRIHRKGRAGFEEDALRAFASHMFHGSHQLARMKYSMELGDLIDQAEREAKRTRSPVRSGLVVEQARLNHDYVMNPTSNRISQVATQGAFMWYLAQSPAAALVNMSQTFIVAPAKLAAFYDKGAAAGIPVALGYLNRAMFDLGMGRTFAEKSARVTPEEKRAVSEAYRMGLITRTQSHDVAGIGDSGVKYSPIRAKLMAALSFMFHHTERINREATFLAAYRMAKKRGLDPKNAIRKAADLTWDSHYDYQNSSRPAIMHSNTGKALLVFRNYSLNMLADLAYTAYEMVNPRNKQERREARTQMLGLGATLAFNAGIRGLPLYGLLMAIAGMFSDDGEDPEVELKKTMLQHFPKQMVGIMMDGVPGYLSGVELSGRIGFGDLWFRSDDMDREGDAQFLYWLQQVLGASAGIPYNWYRGVSQINDGYTWRGIETMVPKAIKDPMKAWRYYNEGVSTKNGDPIVDDVGGWNIFKQAMGFTPAKVTEQYKMNSYNMNKQKAITEERSKLLGDFYKAWKAGDEKKVDQITDKMREYSEKYPEMRIDAGTVRSSLSRREKYRGSALGGMNYNQKLVPRLQDEQPGTVYR